MNGSQYDEQMREIKDLEDLATSDPRSFCKQVLQLVTNTPATQGYTFMYSNLRTNVHHDDLTGASLNAASILLERYRKYFSDQYYSYIEKRAKEIEREIVKYNAAASLNSFLQEVLQLFNIVGAASIAVIIYFFDTSKYMAIIISALVTISATLIRFYHFRDKASYFKTYSKKIKREYKLYENSRESYQGLKKGAAIDLLIDRVDQINREMDEISTKLEEKIQKNQEKEIEQSQKHIKIIEK